MVVGCPVECTCTNDGADNDGVADCSGRNLQSLPVFTENKQFEILYLTRNGIVGVNSIFEGHSASFREIHLDNGLNGVNNYMSEFFFGGTDVQEKSIELVNLEKNLISKVPEFIFSDLENLVSVSLAENELTEVPEKTFGKNRSLMNLDLSKNLITNLPLHLFSNNSELRNVMLSENKLISIDSLFEFQQNLVNLDLESNSISTISSTTLLSTGSSLNYLNLANNRLTEIPENGYLSNLSVLTELSLHNNLLTTGITRKMFTGTGELRELTISSNLLKSVNGVDESVADSVFGNELSKLTSLDLNSNNVSALGLLQFNGCSALIALDLSRNDIENVDKFAFFGLGKLEDINLSRNLIEFLPDGLFGADTSGQGSRLSSLRTLDISYNELVEFPQPALTGENIELRYLDTSHNRIQEILDLNHQLFKNLAVLDASFNEIENVDLTNLDSLISLDLSVNKITDFEVVSLDNVVDADLHENFISKIDLSEWASLRNLYLSHNQLDYSMNLFLPENLKTLDVSYNLLQDFRMDPNENGGPFSGNSDSIQHLDLSGNFLTKFDIYNALEISDCSFRETTFLNISFNNLEILVLNDSCFSNLEILDAGFNYKLETVEIEYSANLEELILSNNTGISSSGKLANCKL